jgi:hypothetical protein
MSNTTWAGIGQELTVFRAGDTYTKVDGAFYGGDGRRLPDQDARVLMAEMEAYQALTEAQKREKSIRDRGLGDPKRLIASATILHEGWEMDNEAWLYEMADGSLKAFTTSHGGVCEMSTEDLQQHLEEVESSAAEIRAMLSGLAV